MLAAGHTLLGYLQHRQAAQGAPLRHTRARRLAPPAPSPLLHRWLLPALPRHAAALGGAPARMCWTCATRLRLRR